MRYGLRPYQTDAIDKLRATYKKGNRRVVLVSPTGSGKTVIASALVELATLKNNGRVLFIAHRKEIIDQTSKKLDEVGVPHGIMMGDDGRRDTNAPVQVASIQTLIRRELPQADFIIIDECHLSLAKSYVQTIQKYNNTPVLGLTATPWRTDGQGLGLLYQDMVVVAQVKELVSQGFLVNPEFYAPYRPDLSKIRVRAGDYVEGDLSKVMDKAHLIGSITEHWLKHANGLCTVVFASSRQHSAHIIDQFQKIGVAARHIDHETTREERNAVLEQLATGQIQVVSNVGLLTEGWDLPQLQCIILARPTMSESLYLQMVGRVMRTTPGKTRAMVMDHAGCLFHHNSPIAHRNYDLKNNVGKRNKKIATNKTRICPDCYRVCASHHANCRNCGHMFSRPAPVTVPGELILRHEYLPSCKDCGKESLIKARTGYISENAIEYRCSQCGVPNILATTAARDLNREKRHAEFYKLRAYAKVKDYKPDWAIFRYKDMFGVRPDQDGF